MSFTYKLLGEFMEKIKKYSISIGITIGLILIFAFFLNILNYFNLISTNAYKIILIFMTSISVFIGAYLLGKETNKKGYLEGIKYGFIITILFWIISFLAFDENLKISNLLYYLVILVISSIGSMFGINKKNEKNIS